MTTRFLLRLADLTSSSMIRRLRLISGLAMLAYVTMHLLNHAVGLISLEAMEQVLWYIFRIWSNRSAQLLLYGSFLAHYALALYALWQRRTLRLRGSEVSQLVLGFAIPILLVRHVVVTRISDSFFHTDVGYYSYLLWVYFVRSPDHGFVQLLVLMVAWGHAMIGLHFWLRVRPWYGRLQPVALVVAVLIPVLSLLGTIGAGRQVIALAIDPNWIGERVVQPSAQTQRSLEAITELLSWLFAGMVVRCCWRASHTAVGNAATVLCVSLIRTVASSRSRPAPACWKRAASPGSRTPRCAGAAAAAPLAASGCAAIPKASIPLERTSCAYSAALAQHPISGSPASCGPAARST